MANTNQDDVLHPIDVQNDKTVPNYILDQMKVAEKENVKRADVFKKILYGGRYTVAVLASIVVGIYGYTMFAVKQETSLDDFDEPELEYIDDPNTSN